MEGFTILIAIVMLVFGVWCLVFFKSFSFLSFGA